MGDRIERAADPKSQARRRGLSGTSVPRAGWFILFRLRSAIRRVIDGAMPTKLTKAFFNEVRGLIVSARQTVARGVDLVQVQANFEIGRRIVEQEQQGKGRAAYGEEVLKALADRLTLEFGKGFSQRNLASMRTFFLAYQDRQNILQSATAKLPVSPKSQTATGKLPGTKKSQTASGKSAAGRILQTASAKSEASRKGQSLIDQLETPPLQKGQTLSDQLETPPPRPFTLGWSHYVFLLGIKNPDERFEVGYA